MAWSLRGRRTSYPRSEASRSTLSWFEPSRVQGRSSCSGALLEADSPCSAGHSESVWLSEEEEVLVARGVFVSEPLVFLGSSLSMSQAEWGSPFSGSMSAAGRAGSSASVSFAKRPARAGESVMAARCRERFVTGTPSWSR